MDSAVLSQAMIDLIGEREVEAAVFTTFTFDPEFFELEIIPLLLDRGLPYSTDDVIKRLTVRENLRSADLKLDVYFDQPQFIDSGYPSPQMEYGYFGVTQRNGVFHPKTVLILLRDIKTQAQTLLHCAGSNNLTRAGWWDNIECTHWVKYGPDNLSSEVRESLLEELSAVAKYTDPDSISASLLVRQFIESCSATVPVDASCLYFPYSEPASNGRFVRFLSDAFLSDEQDRPWQLEIISPFFADNANNTEHAHFLEAGVGSIKVLLPLNEQQEARCSSEYFQWISTQEHIEWAQWADEEAGSLGVSAKPFRALHAKVYHFYNDEVSWVFVGSVNFTHKAMNDNAEAGYLVKVDTLPPLLKSLNDLDSVKQFEEPTENSPGSVIGAHENLAPRPDVRLVFDWKTKALRGRLLQPAKASIDLSSFDEKPLLSTFTLTSTDITISINDAELSKYFERNSFVIVQGDWSQVDSETPSPFSKFMIPIAQVNWTHKPLNLPKLSPSQIIAIYAGISDEERMLIIQSAKVQQLLLSDLALYDNDPLDGKAFRDFFSEYAEIFNGFRKLRQTIRSLSDQGRETELDYYLSGTGVDSLTTLVDELDQKLNPTESRASREPVTEYLILLSIEGLLRDPACAQRPNVSNLLTRIQTLSVEYEHNGRIRLDSRDPEIDSDVFFKWYRAQFFAENFPGAQA